MLVSAIIPTYNRREYICRAIDSVLIQSVPVHELIVVDDGSKDGTADLIEEKYGSKVRVIRQQNTGVAGARHHGIREACGEWIAFLDSDDCWMPNRNGQLLEAAAKLPEDVAWIFGDLRIVTDEGESTTLFEEHELTVHGNPQIFEDSLSVQFPFQFGLLQGSFIRRSALVELDCFSERLRSDDDLLAGFQVACHYRFAAIPHIVGKYYRTSDLSATSVVVNGVFGKDHFRSRMLAFAEVIKTRSHRSPWNERYAAEVLGLCKVLASAGDMPYALPFQQFEYGGYSLKGIAFMLAGILGQPGVRAWTSTAQFVRKHFIPHPPLQRKAVAPHLDHPATEKEETPVV